MSNGAHTDDRTASSALAEDARINGPAPDCGARIDVLVARHRARIDATRRVVASVEVEAA